QRTADSLKETIQWLVKTLHALLQTVRYLLQAVASLLQTVLLALKEGLTIALRPLARGLASAVQRLGEVLRAAVLNGLRPVPRRHDSQRAQQAPAGASRGAGSPLGPLPGSHPCSVRNRSRGDAAPDIDSFVPAHAMDGPASWPVRLPGKWFTHGRRDRSGALRVVAGSLLARRTWWAITRCSRRSSRERKSSNKTGHRHRRHSHRPGSKPRSRRRSRQERRS